MTYREMKLAAADTAVVFLDEFGPVEPELEWMREAFNVLRVPEGMWLQYLALVRQAVAA